MSKYFLSLLFIFLFSVSAIAQDSNLAQYLQNISVTVKAIDQYNRGGTGSGVIVTREVMVNDKLEKISFVWTAGHVVDNLRSVRTVIEDGKEKKVVEFKDAVLVKQLIERGRKVGQLEMDCKVLKYSDADNGEDLALLMVRKRDFVDVSAKFYLEDELVSLGTNLFHVGSLLGQSGANSMTSGIMSQVGRVLPLGTGDGVVFDQTNATSFPGSSGGGVYLAKDGRCIGLVVRGAGEGFVLILPVRRMVEWAKETNVLWALDPNVKVPSLKNILKSNTEHGETMGPTLPHDHGAVEYPFLLKEPYEIHSENRL